MTVCMQMRHQPPAMTGYGGTVGTLSSNYRLQELCIHMGFFQEASPSLAKNPIQPSIVGLKTYEGPVGKYHQASH